MYDYKIVEQVTRKKKKLSGVLKKTMVFFAVVFVLMGITISQAFMLAAFVWQVCILFTEPSARGIMSTPWKTIPLPLT